MLKTPCAQFLMFFANIHSSPIPNSLMGHGDSQWAAGSYTIYPSQYNPRHLKPMRMIRTALVSVNLIKYLHSFYSTNTSATIVWSINSWPLLFSLCIRCQFLRWINWYLQVMIWFAANNCTEIFIHIFLLLCTRLVMIQNIILQGHIQCTGKQGDAVHWLHTSRCF